MTTTRDAWRIDRANTAQRIGRTTTLADDLRNQIDHLLTWCEITPEERDAFTRAANAADMVVHRMRLLPVSLTPAHLKTLVQSEPA